MSPERSLKYQEIESYMLQELSTGRFPIHGHFFTEKEVAQRFGVTILTCRKAFSRLQERGYISRHRGIGTLVEKLPLRPQRMKTIKQCIIGIVVGRSQFDNSFKVGQMILALHRAIEKAGYLALLCGDDVTPLVDADVSGVIAIDRVRPERLAKLMQTNLPLVGIHPDYTEIPSVSFDYAEAADRIVETFRSRGAKHIAMIGEGTDALAVRNQFEQEMASAAKRSGVSLSFAVPPIGDAYEAISKLLDSTNPPDALFAMNSWCLHSLERALRERSLVMGRDLSVLVNGSNALLFPGAPAYSIVDIDIDKATAASVDLLQEVIRERRNPESAIHRRVSPYGEIQDRGSIRPAQA